MAAQPPPGAWVPQHHRDITLGRLDGYLAAGQWADANLRADLWAARDAGAVGLAVYSHPKDVPYPTYDEAVRMPYKPAAVGDAFGPSWTTHWFRVTARVPAEWDGRGPLMFRWDSGCEAMLFTDGPTPRQGITDSRNEYVLAEAAVGGQEYLFYVEMAANTMFGNGAEGIAPPDENRFFTLKTAELCLPNVPATALLHDLRALTGLARELPPGNATGEAALYAANKIVNTYRRGDAAAVAACRDVAARVLAVRDAHDRMQVYAVGHCHIDTAWLWPFSETHRKTARSWSAQLRLAERFPWHVFTASSAQQYEWLLADYPGLFAEIQEAAARGSFVPVGGTWVEMDTNLPGGESLVRQFLYGQRFFQRHFGARCDVFWLPDTFGYSGQLPQLANGAGIKYFLTQKLSWNNINAFPHSTFRWLGLDGSCLLTHFPPANTYNAQADAHDILATAAGSKDKDRCPAAYMLYGNGDGGGGPTVDMCESLARLGGCRGLASLRLAPPSAFFRAAEAASEDLLAWRGELYFELHRGTYTSHAANKSDNRSSELLLREAEQAAALAAAVLPEGAFCYPRAELDEIWKDVLLFQFHDVLPGSAIERVYERTAERYPQILSALRRIRDAAIDALLTAAAPPPPPPPPAALPCAAGGGTILGLSSHEVAGARLLPPLPPPQAPYASAPPAGSAAARGGGGGGAVGGAAAEAAPAAWVYNSLSFRRREVVTVPAALLPPGSRVRQWNASRTAAVVVVEAPPMSLTPVTPADVAAGATPAAAAAFAAAAAVSAPIGGGGGVTAVDGSGDVWDAHGATCRSVVRQRTGGGGGGSGGGSCAGGGEGEELSYVLQNSMVRAVFDGAGRLVSLYDSVWERELVPEGGAGNVFRLYEDIPLFWDAWDIEVYHLEKGRLAGGGDLPPPKVTILESGPLRCRLAISAPLTPTSSLQQVVTLTAASPRLDFHTEVEWAESRTALKVEFPLALDAPAATYEVQFGAVARPTHTNTSWDWARFEVCAHKWADLCEPGYGCALLNDCKYGHATHGNVMRLTLLRSPKAPDAHTDIGTHALRYALLPHAFDWTAAGVPAHGWAFNAPLRVHAPPPTPVPAAAVPAAAVPAAAAGAGSGEAGLQPGMAALRLGGGGGCGAAVDQTAYDPRQPLFTVHSAAPHPLCGPAGRGGPHRDALAATPLILDTVKLAEPPLEPALRPHPLCQQRQQHQHGGAAGGAAAAAAPAAAAGTALVLRLYEPHGARGTAAVVWPAWLAVERAVGCNLLEDDEQEATAPPQPRASAGADDSGVGGGGARVLRMMRGGGGVHVPYTPYKVISIKLYLKAGARRR